MTFFRLLLRNLFYHWRGNFAVLLGIVLGSAVLTGALLVGDSLRGSLRALTLDQLGWIEQAMLPGRFFRASIIDELAAKKRSAVLLLQGSATRRPEEGDIARVGKVTVLGIDAAFWPENGVPGDVDWAGAKEEVVLNQTLADALGAKVGDRITLRLERGDSAPRESILGHRKTDNVIEPVRVIVKGIVPDTGLGRFSVRPSPLPPRNAFVPIRLLQNQLDMAGRANAVFLAGAGEIDLQKALTLDDWGLRYRSPKERAEALVKFLDSRDFDSGKLKRLRWAFRDEKGDWVPRVPQKLADVAIKNNNILTREQIIAFYEAERDYYNLESQRMVLEPMVVKAVERLVPNFGRDADKPPRWQLTPILIYLADSLTDGKRDVPYAIVAGVDHEVPPVAQVADDQVKLMSWPGSPFNKLKAGSPLTIAYYMPDARNQLKKEAVTLKVHPLIEPIEGVLDDPDITPEFKGITDKLDIGDWQNPPFPFDNKRVKHADEDFWKRYRTTPRAYVSLKKAQELWGTRFGNLTSIQVRGGDPIFFPDALLKELKPEQGGFVLQPVRDQAKSASEGATDFGVLFLAFSFFLIVAALLLVGLLVRLNIDRRAAEMGVLLATGWTHRRVRWLLLTEGAILAFVGTLLGLGGALLYADWMLKLLVANWPGGAALNFLRLHIGEHSLIHGFVLSLVASLVTLWWATRSMTKRTPRSLLSGETTQTGMSDTRLGWSRWLLPVGLVGAIGLAAGARFMPSHEAQAGTFFGSGALLLMACLALVWNALKLSNQASSPQPTVTRLGFRNASRHLVRSVLTVGLLASASFLIVAVESFHKDADQHFLEKTGGSGGFTFFAEGSVPVFEDLSDINVRRDHGLDTPELRNTKFYGCRLQPGDDASCLGLYKPLKPRVMGVPKTLIERGGFEFAKSAAVNEEDKENPWRLLEGKADDAIPAILDANTAQWILKVGLSDAIEVLDGNGEKVKLRVVGLLQDSIFQSEVLVSEANFLKLFPQQAGFSFFLIDTDDADVPTVQKQLATGFEDFGLDVDTTASRLQSYVAVENMYLLTFQALGGLGLILGALGLAIVLLRGVWERRAELALLLALGFRSGQLAWLVLAENALLLAVGLAAGTVSALLAVAPHLIGAGAHVLWVRIALLLALVLAVGLVSATLAVFSTLRTPVLTALRRE